MFDSSFLLDYKETDFIPREFLTTNNELVGAKRECSGEKGEEEDERRIHNDDHDSDLEGKDDRQGVHDGKKRKLMSQVVIDQLDEAQTHCKPRKGIAHTMQF